MPSKKYYVTKLSSEFNQRTIKNPSYSIRSFARDLNIDSSSLSAIMSGKRKIPKLKMEFIADKICLDETEKDLFLKSADHDHITLKSIKGSDAVHERHQVDEHDFANISDVKTYTLLSLLELEDFQYDIAWIAKKLKLDVESVEDKITSLLDVGLVEEIDGSLVRTKKRTTTTDEISSKYITKHHLDSLDLAKEKCVELLPSERYFSTVTIPSDPESMGHVKKLIMEFEDKLEAYLHSKKKKDVFKLSIQFYQATEKD